MVNLLLRGAKHVGHALLGVTIESSVHELVEQHRVHVRVSERIGSLPTSLLLLLLLHKVIPVLHCHLHHLGVLHHLSHHVVLHVWLLLLGVGSVVLTLHVSEERHQRVSSVLVVLLSLLLISVSPSFIGHTDLLLEHRFQELLVLQHARHHILHHGVVHHLLHVRVILHHLAHLRVALDHVFEGLGVVHHVLDLPHKLRALHKLINPLRGESNAL